MCGLLPTLARGHYWPAFSARALRDGALARRLLPAPAQERHHAEDGEDEQEAPEDADALVDAAERQRDELDDRPADEDQRDHQQDQQRDAAGATPPRRVAAGRDEAHEAQGEQLAVRRRRLAELLGGGLEVVRAAL